MTVHVNGAGVFPPLEGDEVDVEILADYLRSRDLVPEDAAISAERLTGGVSADVVAVRIEAASGSQNWVIKRALPKLRVASAWVAAPKRAITEARAMEVAARILPGRVPDVLYVDPVAFVIVQQRAHPSLRDWRASLLAGPRAEDLETAAALGTSLATLHSATTDRSALSEFGDLSALVELRIDPFHRTAAAALPDAASRLDELADELIERRYCLVHGDFTPKNVLADGSRLQILDWEVAHIGNPVFDIALLLAHFVCKAVHRPGSARGYVTCAREIHHRYIAGIAPALRPDERSIAAHLAAFVLARTDGKSPAAYLTADQKRTARNLALGWLGDSSVEPADIWNELTP
jgi:aminoglycoside phosphotransferase (APT) family kinase protein